MPPAQREEFVVSEVIVVIGAGSIGQAIARRVSAGKHVVLGRPAPGERRRRGRGDARRRLRREHRDRRCVLARIGARARRDRHQRSATSPGVIHAAGVSPSQASPASHPRRRPVRNRARARGVRQRHRTRWRRGGHRVAVRAPPRRPHRRAGHRAGDHPGRRAAASCRCSSPTR